MRQLSIEQLETYERQRAAAEKLRTLNEAQAQAAMQTQLTNARVQVQIAESHGEADLARARKQAEQTVVVGRSRAGPFAAPGRADGADRRGRGPQAGLAGRGEGQNAMQVGLAEASVLLRKIASFGDPRLYALSIVAEQLAHSTQPLVPERVFVNGAAGERAPTAMMGLLWICWSRRRAASRCRHRTTRRG